MIRELVARTRSCRRFRQERAIERETLEGLVATARLIPSAGNKQPLRYLLSCAAQRNDLIFDCLSWAAYLTDWPGPAQGERPAAYVVVLGDKDAGPIPWDHGIAAYTLVLAAAEQGLAGCIIASIDKARMRKALSIPSRYEIHLVVALGVAGETVVVEEMEGGQYRYWRDREGIHHVPKRSLEELIVDL